jgi:nickel/cobalt transporter (NiCoT) family protein
MTLVDSLDSVVMAYSYTGLLQRKKGLRLIEKVLKVPIPEEEPAPVTAREENEDKKVKGEEPLETTAHLSGNKGENTTEDPTSEAQAQLMELKQYTTSNLGITLTLMSIVVAFR